MEFQFKTQNYTLSREEKKLFETKLLKVYRQITPNKKISTLNFDFIHKPSEAIKNTTSVRFTLNKKNIYLSETAPVLSQSFDLVLNKICRELRKESRIQKFKRKLKSIFSKNG